MKKIVCFMVALFAFVLLNVPFGRTAEAATVAVVPIDINTDKVARASDFSSYYWDMIVDRFQYPEYELMDDEKVSAILPDEGLKSFSKESLMGVAEKASAEIVVAMRITEVKEMPKSFLREPAVQCIMKGELATFNKITGKYYYKNIYYNEQIEEVLTVRNDWQQMAFADFLRRGINRTLEDNKKKK